MDKMDDAVASLNAALQGSTDEVELAMGRVKGYLRHLKGGKVVQVKGHDRHFEPGSAADFRDQASRLRRADSSVAGVRMANRLDDMADRIKREGSTLKTPPQPRSISEQADRATLPKDLQNAEILARPKPGQWIMSGPGGHIVSVEWGGAHDTFGEAGSEPNVWRFPDTEPLPRDIEAAIQKERDKPTADDFKPKPMSASEQADRAPELGGLPIGVSEVTHGNGAGRFVVGAEVIFYDDSPEGRADGVMSRAEALAIATSEARDLYLSRVDKAEDALLVELAGLIDVKSYFRRTKSGKTVNVKSYKRKVLGADLKPGDTVKDTFGKKQTVSSVAPDKVTFQSGKTASPTASFEKLNAPEAPASGTPNPTAIRAVQGRKSTGYDAARVARAGNKGAEGATIPKAEKSRDAKVEPLTDEEYLAHTQKIEQEIGKALSEGKATDKQFAVDANSGVWEFDRAQRHREIADAMWKARAEQVPNDGKAMISGGLGGAGKSTVLKTVPGADEGNYFTINSDDVKEHIAENFPDMIPEAGDLSPLERVALIHEESSHIADLLAARAYAEKKNMIWDITMASQKSVQKRLDDLRANGYTDVQGVFVNIDVETSVSRALARHRRGMEDFRNGKGKGGRYVPPAIIRLNKSDKSSSANLDTFTALRDQFNSWHQYNNNVTGRAPVKEGSGSGSAASSVAADPFVNIANMTPETRGRLAMGVANSGR